MDLTQELAELRLQTQMNQVEHLRVEVNLIATFLEMSNVERDSGHFENSIASLEHADQAIAAARRGLRNIESSEIRSEFKARLNQLEAKLRSQTSL